MEKQYQAHLEVGSLLCTFEASSHEPGDNQNPQVKGALSWGSYIYKVKTVLKS